MEALLARTGVRIALGILALIGVALIPIAAVQHIEIHGYPFIGGGLRDQVADLNKQINDEDEGYIVRLDRAKLGGQICEAALARQSAAVKGWQASADENTARANELLAAVKTQSDQLRRMASDILASQTKGDACIAAFNRNRDLAR